MTLPGTTYPRGSLHMVTHAISEIASIFAKIGFIRMSYPEIEWEYYSFESLNMPATHPARDDIETFLSILCRTRNWEECSLHHILHPDKIVR